MILIPLCGSGTRGDQVDNAEFFAQENAAKVLLGKEADKEHLIEALNYLLIEENRKSYSEAVKALVNGRKPAEYIAQIIFEEM